MALTTVDGSLISSGAITLTTQVTGTLPEANGGTGTTVGYCGFKNRIINGGMVIDQRNAGASVTPTSITNLTYNVDRWSTFCSVSSKFTVQQNAGSVTPPVGFSNYLGVTSLSAYSITATDNFTIRQYIEGYNFSDLSWGTANAKTITLSAWVYSSLTGTFGGVVANYAFSRSYPFTYSIPVANTWTQISVTIAGDTSGTWVGGSNAGAAAIAFSLGTGATYSGTAGAWSGTTYTSATGATSVVGTNGATFYITGVQLEKGSTATSFDYRPYGQELVNCYRYFRIYNKEGTMYGYGANNSSTTIYRWGLSMDVPMRVAPTVAFNSMVGWSANGGVGGTISIQSNLCSINALDFDLNYTSGSVTQGVVVKAYANTSSSSITVSAEL